jgi:NADH dehydrogenase
MRLDTVTVFGASGFIGRHLVKRLAARGAVIRAVSRDPERALHLKPLGDVGQIVLLPAPAEPDAEKLRGLVEGADLVVNLVGILYERRRGDFEKAHVHLARAIAEAAVASGCRALVQISAIGADPASPSLYARTKAQGEAAVREAFPGATILRPSIVFGPEDSFFNRFARMAQFSPVLPIVGARTRFQPVYVGDVAEAVIAAALADDAPGRLYELGGPRVYTFGELIRYMLKVTGRRRLVIDLPLPLARLVALFAEWLPEPPITRDQILLLQRDNVVSPDAPGLRELAIRPTPLEVIVPQYLVTYARRMVRLPVV